MDRPLKRASAHDIADFACMGGDLTPIALGQPLLLGGEIHRELQNAFPAGTQAEAPVKLRLSGEYVDLEIAGRMDGYNIEEGRIIEIKSTSAPLDALELPREIDLAQAIVYGEFARQNHGHAYITIEMVYIQAASREERVSVETFPAEEIRRRFEAYALPYLAMLDVSEQRKIARNAQIEALAFPYADFRPSQRDMSAQVFTALRKHKKLFLHAPTGSGKTAGTLFGALKALARGHCDRVFYLTQRGTGALQPLAELQRMALTKSHIIALRAKEKVCPEERLHCADGTCPFAVGYYDRLGDALLESAPGGIYDSAKILDIALRNRLCPHELSLDLALIYGDVVVGDVNYFFAPSIVLHRFFSGRSQAGLLIDEAHQLEGRVRDMHTAQITKGRFTAFRRDFGKEQGRKNDVYKSAGLIINILKEMPASGCLPLLPDGLFDALLSFADALDGHLWSRPNGGMQEYLLEIRDFLQIARLWDAHFGALCEPGGRLTITLRTPYALIAAKIAKTHGCVAFSGTLQPLASYAKILGGEDEDACLRLPSPYPTENQRTAIWPIDMRFAERGKRIPDIVALLRLIADKPGNYMVCFPSYAFLRAVFEACESMDIQAQQSGMDESQRGEFLAMFAEKPDRARIFFVVMGGVFAESVDLPGDRLSGAIILGLGLPQIGEFREAIMASYEEWLGDGFHYAYMLPGMSRVVQAAGRVIRSRTDRGFVILADSRFLNRRYAALLPDHWDIRICRDMPALRGIL